jgi:glycerate 2-kinase
MQIKNRESLLSRGNVSGRKAVLDIIDAGIAAADPYPNTLKLLNRDGDTLRVGPVGNCQVFDLRKIRHIYITGGGKAVQRQAKAFEEVLGDRITEGHINIKKGEEIELSRVDVTLAGHPLPDEDSVKGARKIYEILKKAGEGDIVFWLRSGGGTSLLAFPVEGITLDELKKVSEVLYFGAGASMPEINVVRNLISVLGLKHAKYVHGATLFEFLADEIPAGTRGHAFSPNPGSGHPYDRAVGVINKYGVWERLPQSVRAVLRKADPANLPPSPAELQMRPFHLHRVIDPNGMLNAAQEKGRDLGLNAYVLATSLNDVEARPAAEFAAEIAQEIQAFGRPLPPPCVFIIGGEVTVATGDEKGEGGRNQEFALSAATRIAGSSDIVIASVDSDGTDGPTSLAGAVVDGSTVTRVKAAGFDLETELRHHNSTAIFEALGDAIVLGNTGTNLRDLRIVYVRGQPHAEPVPSAPP